MIELHGTINTIQELPASESPIDLTKLETWEKLSEEQQYFLSVYFNTYPNRIVARMESGVSNGVLSTWIKQDKHFSMAFAEIEELHKENLSALHYKSAYADSRTRKDVLKSIGARGYDDKKSKTTNILNVGNASMQDLIKSINQ